MPTNPSLWSRIFGWRFNRDQPKTIKPDDFIRSIEDKDAIVVSGYGEHAVYSAAFNAVFNDRKEQLETYRRVAMNPYVDSALDDLVDEAVDFDQFTGETVKINLDKVEISEEAKEKISEEFKEILRLLSYSKTATETFRDWLIDGVQNYFVVLHDKPENGIRELRRLDSRFIQKVKKLTFDNTRSFEENLRLPDEKICYVFMIPEEPSKEYGWLNAYRQSAIGSEAVEITEEAIIQIDSGFFDIDGTQLSILQRALRPLNQLSMLEDATVIYRIARAPERRVFYVDVGDLQPNKAEQYLKGIISKFRNKAVINTKSGIVEEKYDVHSMMEDIWLPRGSNGKSTEVTTLQAGQNLGEIEDVQYFRRKLYKALKIPISRLEAETNFNLGRSAEITRDEVRFSKYIGRICNKFSKLFYEALKRQLVLKKIVTPEEWLTITDKIEFVFSTNSYFQELKGLEMLAERMTRLGEVDAWVGKYFSKKWVQRRVLNLSEEEILVEDQQIDQEIANGKITAGTPGAAVPAPPQPEAGDGNNPSQEAPPAENQEAQDFSPEGQDFSPEGEDFSPEGQDFSPEGEDFSPESPDDLEEQDADETE